MLSHFSADLSNLKERRLKEKTYSIKTLSCATELHALLKEQNEIKRLKPFFNRMGIREKQPWGIYFFGDFAQKASQFFELRILNEKNEGEFPQAQKILSASTLGSAKGLLESLKREHHLCSHWISFHSGA